MSAALKLMAAILVVGVAPATWADDAQARRELVPTGALREAVAVAPAPSAFWAARDAASDGLRGVTISLGAGLARQLNVPIAFVIFPSSGEIVKSAAPGGEVGWDVTFVPADDERKKILDFGTAYHLLQSTYLVAPGSTIASIADANAAGVRIAGVEGTATMRASMAASARASNVAVRSVEEAIVKVRAGEIEAMALSREALGGLATQVPGNRVLEGGFLNATTAIALPRGRPAALAHVSAYIEAAKSSGAIRQALDEMGLRASIVAPPGLIPTAADQNL